MFILIIILNNVTFMHFIFIFYFERERKRLNGSEGRRPKGEGERKS